MGCQNSKQTSQPQEKQQPFTRNGVYGDTDPQKCAQNFLSNSPSTLDKKKYIKPSPNYDWGKQVPLENVINSAEDLKKLEQNKNLLQNGIHIVEPWDHVGYNPTHKEPVRASLNVQYVAQNIADIDSILYPVWQTGKNIPIEKTIQSLSQGYATVFEGGEPDPFDSKTFTYKDCPREFLFELYKQVILNSQDFRRCIFICLSHQLLAATLVELVKDFTSQALGEDTSVWSGISDESKDKIKQIAQKIDDVGNLIGIKKNGVIQQGGYKIERFATYRNEEKEVQKLKLHKFESPQPANEGEGWLTQEVLDAYNKHSDQNHGSIEKLMAENNDIYIAMFHSSEVNQEGVIFTGWAFNLIRECIQPLVNEIKGSEKLKWLLNLPIGTEIIASTKNESGAVVTECACFRVDFQNIETQGKINHFYSTQFHPELYEDLRDVRQGSQPTYEQMQSDDGTILLVQLLTNNR